MKIEELIDEAILAAVGSGPVQTDLVYDVVNKIMDPERIYERLAHLRTIGLVAGSPPREGKPSGQVWLTNKGKSRYFRPWSATYSNKAAEEVRDAEDMAEFKARTGRD